MKIVEIIKLFGKLGLIAFGGPAAHIAMIQLEVVEKRKWMSEEKFLDLVGATNLIPGPNSTEMVIHCGYHRGGVIGLIAAGLSFILPAALLTGFLGFLYVSYGEIPQIQQFFYGIKPAVIGLIAIAIFKLGKKAIKNWQYLAIGVSIMAAVALGIHEILAILLGGVIAMIWFYIPSRMTHYSVLPPIFFPIMAGFVPKIAFSQVSLFFIFLKIGAVLFGSGYVLIAYLDAELVESLGLLTREQLLDSVALGQFTPGPLLTTATFIGYLIGDLWGAALATLGIFLPAFVFVLILSPLVPRLRESKAVSWFLDGVNVGAVSIMLWVTLQLSYSFVFDWRTATILGLSLISVFFYKKLNPVIIVFAGSLLGFGLNLI